MHGRTLLLLALLLFALHLAGCASPYAGSEVTPDGQMFPPDVRQLERAHGLSAWRQQRALRCEIVAEFDGRRVLDGILTFTTDGEKSRLDLRDGTTAIFDGQRAWIAPSRRRASSETLRDARFQLLTWPYLLAVPYKLRDGGVRVASMGLQPLGDGGEQPATAAQSATGVRKYPTLRLTFAPGTGDSPRDWFLLYRDPETSRLKAMAYVITFGARPHEIPDDPQAILYDDFDDVEGAVIATRWTFFDWTAGAGLTGDPRGRATLRNVHFTNPPDWFFQPPPEAVEDPPPSVR